MIQRFSTLGTFEGGLRKTNYQVLSPNTMQGYFSTFNPSVVTYVEGETAPIQRQNQPLNPETRREYRFDDYYPDSDREVSVIPHGLDDLRSRPSSNLKEVGENYRRAPKITNLREISSGKVSQNKADTKEKFVCDMETCGSGEIANLMDPCFNLREVAKQCILLEDHMFQKDRRCRDCISKHCLTIEGFLEEAVTLDKNYEYTTTLQEMIGDFKSISSEIYQLVKADAEMSNDQWARVAQKLRQFRKPVCQKYATNL